ncbi:MFS general substrate transporter [Marasmius fiardii PR-910]|nr:MFS general substrate transporter [Marasmius fiardii PR-910]
MVLGKPEQEWQEEFSQTNYTPGSVLEKKLVRKIDLHIIPSIWALYTLSFLDRANIGNAKSGGMEESLNLTSTQYSIVLPVFFISYVIFEVPANMLRTRVRLKQQMNLSGLCFVWGGVAACMAAVNNWPGFAGFAPGIAHELARRFSLDYTATAVSGAFSGLLAGVITDKLAFSRGIEGWRWLLLIEGAASSAAGNTTKWLTPQERFIATQRLAYDGVGSAGGDKSAEPSHEEAFKMAVLDRRTWLLAIMYMLATGAQTIQYFIPTLVGQLGYSGYIKQYMTTPVYGVALVGLVGFCFVSDYRKERGSYVTLSSLLAGVSFIITVAADNQKVKYAFLCFAVAGVYAACPLTLLWISNIVDYPAEKRAIAIVLVNALGNSASIYGSFLWPDRTGPRYVQGFVTTTTFVLLLAILAQFLKFLVHKLPGERLRHTQSVQEEG